MAARKSPGTDFESRYFDLLIDRLDRQDDKLESILAQTEKTNGKVVRLRTDVDDLQAKALIATKPTWYSDTKLQYIAGICVMVFLLIIAAVLRVEIPGGIAL